MKKLFKSILIGLMLPLLATSQALAVYIPNTPMIVVCGTQLPVAGLIVLSGSENCGSAPCYDTLRANFDSSGYLPSGSKRFQAMVATSVHQISTGNLYYGYANTDVGVGSTSAPSTPIYPANNLQSGLLAYWSSNTGDSAGAAGGAVQNGYYCITMGQISPNGKYPFIREAGASTNFGIKIYGYEVN